MVNVLEIFTKYYSIRVDRFTFIYPECVLRSLLLLELNTSDSKTKDKELNKYQAAILKKGLIHGL